MRPDSDFMTAEFSSDCCTIGLLEEGPEGPLKEGFPYTEFHCTHDSITTTEQVHCHPYQPLTTIAFFFTQNDYITDPQGFWPTDCVVLTSPAFPQYLAEILWINRTIQLQTVRAFSRSCRPSDWPNSFGCQSTVTAAITSRAIFYSAWDSVLFVVTGFGHHPLQP